MGDELSNGIKTDLETRIEQRDNQTASRPNPSTETANQTKRGRGRPRKTETQETGLPGLASVNEPLLVDVSLPGEEKETTTTKTEKKPGRPKKSSTASKAKQIDSTQIQILMVTLSAVLSSRPGMEIWALSSQEAKQIADPLANILAKNQALGNALGEHADAFALLTACAVVFLPKAVMYMATKPKKPKQGAKLHYGTTKPSEPSNTEGTNRSVNTADVFQPSNNAKNNNPKFSGGLSGLIPAVGQF